MEKIKIQHRDLVVGEPLIWSVYGAGGQLLLNEGYILKTENQKELLLSQDLYRFPTQKEIETEAAKSSAEPEEVSPFESLDQIKELFEKTIGNLFKQVKIDYSTAFFDLGVIIQDLCRAKADPALGAIILNQEASYAELHPVLCAILTETLSKRIKIPKQDRLPFIAAAFTQNVGMWRDLDFLSNQTAPLTDKQQKAIQQHPYKSREIMKAFGIDNNDWLDTIFYHHERIDGKGYPQGLSGDDIPIPARILALADIYSAMVLPRQYRDGLYIKKALRNIFMQRGSSVDEHFAQLLIREIGIYPPGAFVMLNNGEIAIVLKHNKKLANCPQVLSVINPRGLPYQVPRKRDTAQEEIFAIEKVVSRPENLKLAANDIWKTGH